MGKMVVEQSRQERKAQLKRAQLEADAQIIELKEKATSEVRAADEDLQSKHADDVKSREEETKTALIEVDKLAEENKEEMIQMLIEWCTNVEPELHENLVLQLDGEKT